MSEIIDQIKARLKEQDKEAERAFQKRLDEIRAASAPWRAEKEKEEREKELRQEKLMRESQEKLVQETKDDALTSYLDAGGAQEDFEKAWPEIRAELLKRAAIEGESIPRAESMRRTLQGF